MTDPTDDPRATEAVGHLQAAATELIAAARAFLDLVEDVVDDPETLTSAASVFGSVARAAMTTVRPGSEYGSPGPDGSSDDPGDGVQHIDIS